MTTNQSKRGRPPKSYKDDKDRFAVALIHALIRLKRDDETLSVWNASQRAALCEYELVSDLPVSYKNSVKYGPSGRKLPKPKGLLDEKYREITFQPIRESGHGCRTYDAHARRLQDKYKKWVCSGTEEADWLDDMSDAWMVALFPLSARQQGLPPKDVCIEAAKRVGELDFCMTILLPHIHAGLTRRGF